MLTASLNGTLGLIPDWQFNADPAINPYLNPHVSMPDGTTQAWSVQPFGPASAGITIPQTSPLYGARGLGYIMIDHPPGDLGRTGRVSRQDRVVMRGAGLNGWAGDHRKGIALGVVGLIGFALLGGLSAILK